MARTKVKGGQLDLSNIAGAGLTQSSGVLSVDINGLTAAAEALHQDNDFLMYSDAGTEKKISFSNFEDNIFGNVSGDATIAAGGALTIAANSVALATDTTGDYVQNLTAGTGLTSTGATSGENIAHSLSVDASQTQITSVGSIGTGVWAATDVAVTHGGTGASDASTARTNLGVAIGTDVQAYDAQLDTLAGFTAAQVTRGIADGNLLTANDAVVDNDWLRIDGTEVEGRSDAEIKSDLSLEIGTDVQAYDAQLDTLAGMAAAAATELAAMADGELEVLDGATPGAGVASKAVVLDASGDFEMQDSDKIFFGDDADVSIHWDGSTMKIGTDTSAAPITIGHSTSEVTVADNLTVAGDLTVTGTTTTVDVEVVNTANGVIFEGATDDAYETTLKAVDPTGADKTIQLANASGYLIPFAAASTTTISSTPAELNVLDGISGLVVADLNVIAGCAGNGLVIADLTKLAGVDASAAELDMLDAVTRGSIIYGNASSATARLAKGAANTVLSSDGTDISYTTVSNDMLAGSIADSKLNQITTGDKVAGSAVELASDTAFEDDSGLKLNSNVVSNGLKMTEGNGYQSLSLNMAFNVTGTSNSGTAHQVYDFTSANGGGAALGNGDPKSMMVFVNGILQRSGSGYDYLAKSQGGASSTVQVTFHTDNAAGDSVYASYLLA